MTHCADTSLSAGTELGCDDSVDGQVEICVVKDDETDVSSYQNRCPHAALPPSSKDSFFKVELLCFISSRPTGVEPVKEIFETKGLESAQSINNRPTSRTSPSRTLPPSLPCLPSRS